MSSLEDKMAATTARSIAGSSTLASGYVEENVFGAKPETGPFPERLKSYSVSWRCNPSCCVEAFRKHVLTNGFQSSVVSSLLE
jgi:hypothetical protein